MDTFYNVYIKHASRDAIYKIALNQQQLDQLLDAFLDGERQIRVKGSFINIENPDKFIIYSITDFDSLGKTQEDIESNLQKYKGILVRGKINLELFRHFGTNVTDKLLNGQDWGSRRSLKTKQIKRTGDKFFVSHSTRDAAIVELFVNHILKLGLGIGNDDIFCTSIDGIGIKSGEDFKARIKTEILNSKVVIQFISLDYKQSEVCLNEMGAAWVLCENTIPIIIPPMSFDVGFIHSNTQQLKINERNDLIKLYEDHKHDLFKEINLVNYNRQIDLFIKNIDDVLKTVSKDGTTVYMYGEKVQIKGVFNEGFHSWPPQENIDEEDNLSYSRYLFVELKSPISVLSNALGLDNNSFDKSQHNITRIQIAPRDDGFYNYYKNFLNKTVCITGDLFGEHTAWHRTPVLIHADSIVLE